jgi:hypothetical protein
MGLDRELIRNRTGKGRTRAVAGRREAWQQKAKRRVKARKESKGDIALFYNVKSLRIQRLETRS